MFQKIKNIRKLQKLNGEHKKLVKKLCNECKKKLASLHINKEDFLKDFVFCAECEPYTKRLIVAQGNLDEAVNKEIVMSVTK